MTVENTDCVSNYQVETGAASIGKRSLILDPSMLNLGSSRPGYSQTSATSELHAIMVAPARAIRQIQGNPQLRRRHEVLVESGCASGKILQ